MENKCAHPTWGACESHDRESALNWCAVSTKEMAAASNSNVYFVLTAHLSADKPHFKCSVATCTVLDSTGLNHQMIYVLKERKERNDSCF